jgi:hypothetical protein
LDGALREGDMRRGRILAVAIISGFVGFANGASGQGARTPISYSLSPTPHVTLTNGYSSRLTGAVIVVSNTDTGKQKEVIWFDSGVNFKHDAPLGIGASLSFSVGPTAESPALRPVIAAVTFENGTTVGDAGWLSKLHERRKAAYDEILAVTDLLDGAVSQHQSGQQVISALKGMQASLGTTTAEPEARIPAGLVIYAAISNLERGGVAGSIGNPETTIPAVILPMFAEWRGALKRYDKTIQ